MDTIVTAAIPIIAGWVLYVDRKVAAHQAVIDKMDQLMTMLLEDRLKAGAESVDTTPRKGV